MLFWKEKWNKAMLINCSMSLSFKKHVSTVYSYAYIGRFKDDRGCFMELQKHSFLCKNIRDYGLIKWVFFEDHAFLCFPSMWMFKLSMVESPHEIQWIFYNRYILILSVLWWTNTETLQAISSTESSCKFCPNRHNQEVDNSHYKNLRKSHCSYRLLSNWTVSY